MSPLVSVLVPVYNSRDFIKETLDSVLDQCYANIQVVVSDDCSTDGTREILLDYAKDSRVDLFLNDSNVGITRNCNQILEACTGKYVALFAGDDVMLPGKLEKQVAFMEANPQFSFSYHPVEVFQSETGSVLYVTKPSFGKQFRSVHDIIRRMGVPGGMSVMCRRDCIPPHGFDTRLNFASDWLFQIELAVAGEIGFMEGVLARYRKYGENNGKDLSSYESEFLKVMEIVSNEHPELAASCAVGIARYYAGFAFRQRGTRDFRKALRKAIDIDGRLVYRAAFMASYLPFFDKSVSWLRLAYKKLVGS